MKGSKEFVCLFCRTCRFEITLILCAGLLWLSALPVYAQSEAADAQAEDTTGQNQNARRSWLERLSLLNDRPSSEEPEYPRIMRISPVFGGLQSGAGLTAGIRVTPYEHRYFDSALEARVSHRKYWGVNGLAGYEYRRYVSLAYARYRHMPEEDFYGLESSSLTPTRTSYRHDEIMTGLLAGFSPLGRALAGIHLSYLGNWVGEGMDDELPSVSSVFSESNAPGLSETDHFAIAGAWFEYDSRDLPYESAYGRRFAPTQRRIGLFSLLATSGLYFTAEYRRYLHLDGSTFGFNEVEVDAEQYLPLSRGDHVFAFREYAVLSGTAGDNDVPFYMMPALGGSSTLRGYESLRFRDRNVLLGNAEYRWKIFELLQIALFADAGYAFPAMDALDLSEPHIGYGAGLRFLYSQRVPLRIDVARGEDGTQVHLRVQSIF
jgi:hypothetical protein